MLFSTKAAFSNLWKNAHEIRCPYNRLGDIIPLDADKRYVILVPEEYDAEKLNHELEKFDKLQHAYYTIGCKNLGLLLQLRQEGRPAYLDFPVTDWETFHNLLYLGVTDILVSGAVAFSMPKMALYVESGLKIRVIPNLSSSLYTHEDFSSFFIRPEDLAKYEPYVNVVEFYSYDEKAEEALFDIYNRGTFLDEIHYLIQGLNSNVNNATILKEFGDSRLSCGQVCKIPGKRCNICTNAAKMYDNLKAVVQD